MQDDVKAATTQVKETTHEERRLVATMRAVDCAADQIAYWRCQKRAAVFADWLCGVAFTIYERHCTATGNTRCVFDRSALCAAVVERQGRTAAVDPHYSLYIASHPAVCAALFIAHCLGGGDVGGNYDFATMSMCAQRMIEGKTERVALHDVCDALVDDWASGVESAAMPHFAVQAMWLTCIGGERSHAPLRQMLHAIIDQYFL